MWNHSNVIKYSFEAGDNESESDELFLDRYCSSRTKYHLAKQNIKATDLRKILRILAPLVPDLDHSTPYWAWDRAGQLLVCIGRAHLQWRKDRPVPVTKQPRFGLCAFLGNIHLWSDEKLTCDASLDQQAYMGFNNSQWLFWEGSENKCYFQEPLAGRNAKQDFSTLLSDNKPLWSLIQEIGGRLDSPSFLLQEAFDPIKARFDMPEEFSVIYPQLIDDGKGLPKVAQPKNTIYRKRRQGDVNEKVVGEENDQEYPPQPPQEPTPVACTDPSAVIQQLADALQLPAEKDAKLTDSPDITGRYYVYVLLDSDNHQPFYVGKGAYDRALQHFRTINLNDGLEDPDEKDKKDKKDIKLGVIPDDILKAEENSGVLVNANDSIVNTEAEANKIYKIKELLRRGVSPNDIPRVVARGLSSHAAYAIEALLIKSVYGMASLSNVVPGHHDDRFRAVGNWDYQVGYDLPVTPQGDFSDDDQPHACGSYYVYVLRDPSTQEIFYVGKGKGNRLGQHFANARSGKTFYNEPRLERLRKLLEKGCTPKQIGRIVARVENEALAYIIESFYMKFVVGFDRLKNIQSGHLYGLFRSQGDWEKRHGFDLPTHASGMRKMLLDIFLGEGLDAVLAEVTQDQHVAAILTEIQDPKLMGAGELASLGQIREVDKAVSLRIQVRCARRIQIVLHPEDIDGREWMQKNFGRFGLYPLHRADDLFIPLPWRGAANVPTDTGVAVERAVRLAKLAQVLQRAKERQELAEFDDLLVGLPRQKIA